MKFIPFRAVVLGGVAAMSLFVGAGTASAIDLGIQVGAAPPPPPPAYERPWARPYRGAVWIRPHNEWRDGRWVWVHGYYDYPPFRGAVWVPGHYRHGYWRPGHWAR